MPYKLFVRFIYYGVLLTYCTSIFSWSDAMIITVKNVQVAKKNHEARKVVVLYDSVQNNVHNKGMLE